MLRKILPLLFLSLLLLSTRATAQMAYFAPRVSELKTNRVPLKVLPDNRMQIIEASINGVACTLILDTGASHTTFNRTFMDKYFPNVKRTPISTMGQGSQTNTVEVPELFSIQSMVLGNTTLTNFYGVSVPLDQLSAATGMRIDGVLGMNTMAYAPFRLSIKDKSITWCPPASSSFSTSPVINVPPLPEEFRFFLNGALKPDGISRPILLDSGSTWTFLDPNFWPKDPNRKSAALFATDVNKTSSESFTAGVSQPMYFGDKPFLLTPYLSADLYQIGADVLERYDWMFDPVKHTFQFIP